MQDVSIEYLFNRKLPVELACKIESIVNHSSLSRKTHITSAFLFSKEEVLTLHTVLTLNELAMLASKIRYILNPQNIVTFLIDRNINYTNICVTECYFCAFYRLPNMKDTYVLDEETILKKVEELIKIGGTRILLQGGHNPKLKLQYYTRLLSSIKRNYPHLQIDGFTPSEIEFIAKVERMDIEKVLIELKAAGLDGLPGGGAEILVDSVREKVSPKKQNSQGWLDVMSIAHKIGLTTTATMVIGLGETFEERLQHLEKIRHLQNESLQKGYKGFISFIMWTAQHDNTALSHLKYSDGFYTTAYDYLETLAISRIFLNNIPHIAASWPTMGEKIASVALFYGADDFGSTMMEENVVSQASSNYKSCMLPEEIIRIIKSNGFIPAQRDSNYNILKIIG